MINFVVAMQTEANPLIDYYKLKPEKNSRFPVYSSEHVALIISGIGRNMASAATAFLAATRSVPVLINVGIAGHPSKALGSLMAANKITEAASGKSWFPVHIKSSVDTEHLTTFDRVQTSYQTDCLHEMEASGFYETALRFSIAELAHSIKIVSDNEEYPVESLERSQIEGLVTGNLFEISVFAEHLCQLASEIQAIDSEYLVNQYQKLWKFSATQQHQLKRLLQRRLALDAFTTQSAEADLIHREVRTMRNSKDVLRWLQNDTDARAEFY